MNTAQIEILDNVFEASNALSLAWHLGNVKDAAKRAELQAPIIAAQEAMTATRLMVEEMARQDGDAREVGVGVYCDPEFLAASKRQTFVMALRASILNVGAQADTPVKGYSHKRRPT